MQASINKITLHIVSIKSTIFYHKRFMQNKIKPAAINSVSTSNKISCVKKQAALELLNNFNSKNIKFAAVQITLAKHKTTNTFFQIPKENQLSLLQKKALADSGFKIKTFNHTAVIINAFTDHIAVAFFTSQSWTKINTEEIMKNIKISDLSKMSKGAKYFSQYINKPMLIDKVEASTYYTFSNTLTESFVKKLQISEPILKDCVQQEFVEGVTTTLKYLNTEEKFLTVKTTLNLNDMVVKDLNFNKMYEEQKSESVNIEITEINNVFKQSNIKVLNVFNNLLSTSDVEQRFDELYGSETLNLLQKVSERLIEAKPSVIVKNLNPNGETIEILTDD